MRKIILPEFQENLRSKSLVQKKYIPFYAHWASKFLIARIARINELPRSRTAKHQTAYDVIPVETDIRRANRLDSRSGSGMTDICVFLCFSPYSF